MTSATSSSYPVTYEVEPQLADRNRLTVAFRIILAIPHAVLVGTPGFGITSVGGRLSGKGGNYAAGGNGGLLSVVAFVMAVISWFAIVFTGKQPKGLWDFNLFYLKWRARAISYMALLRDEYPPFGNGEYPAELDVGEFQETRDRLSVGLRLLYVIPHAIVLFFIGIAWVVTVIIAWFAILFTGAYPEGLYKFGVGYLRWSLRVEAYLLLMQDAYPPFSLE